MGNSYFEFKKFRINQDQTAMKVGADSVILGAWADIEKGQRLLDIGAGTGLLALMCAQRNSEAIVDAVEIDEAAWRQACHNIEIAPYKVRINCFHISIQEYATEHRYRGIYDAIISNPPYFEENVLPNEQARAQARHTIYLTYHEIFEMASWLMKPEGKLSLVFPAHIWRDIEYWSWQNRLYANRRLTIYHREEKEPKRMCADFTFRRTKMKEERLVIESGSGEYSEQYRELTKDFYLSF